MFTHFFPAFFYDTAQWPTSFQTFLLDQPGFHSTFGNDLSNAFYNKPGIYGYH